MNEQEIDKEKEHPLLVEMAKVGPQCNWIRHDGAYTEEDKIAQEKFLELESQYYNDPDILGTTEEKIKQILNVSIRDNQNF